MRFSGLAFSVLTAGSLVMSACSGESTAQRHAAAVHEEHDHDHDHDHGMGEAAAVEWPKLEELAELTHEAEELLEDEAAHRDALVELATRMRPVAEEIASSAPPAGSGDVSRLILLQEDLGTLASRLGEGGAGEVSLPVVQGLVAVVEEMMHSAGVAHEHGDGHGHHHHDHDHAHDHDHDHDHDHGPQDRIRNVLREVEGLDESGPEPSTEN